MDDLEREMCKLYENGASLGELGKRYGVCGVTIGKRLRLHKVKIRRRGAKRKIENEAQVVSRYQDGESASKLSVELGVSIPTVCNLLGRHNAKRETRFKPLRKEKTDE